MKSLIDRFLNGSNEKDTHKYKMDELYEKYEESPEMLRVEIKEYYLHLDSYNNNTLVNRLVKLKYTAIERQVLISGFLIGILANIVVNTIFMMFSSLETNNANLLTLLVSLITLFLLVILLSISIAKKIFSLIYELQKYSKKFHLLHKVEIEILENVLIDRNVFPKSKEERRRKSRRRFKL